MGKIIEEELSKAFNPGNKNHVPGGTPFDQHKLLTIFGIILSPDILSAELTEGNAETDADQNTSDMLPELVQSGKIFCNIRF